jgi:hypothetical protein
MSRYDRSRADAGRFGTMYDEGACMATPALELIERANREAAEARRATRRSGSSGAWRFPIAAVGAMAGRLARRVGLRGGRA